MLTWQSFLLLAQECNQDPHLSGLQLKLVGTKAQAILCSQTTLLNPVIPPNRAILHSKAILHNRAILHRAILHLVAIHHILNLFLTKLILVSLNPIQVIIHWKDYKVLIWYSHKELCLDSKFYLQINLPHIRGHKRHTRSNLLITLDTNNSFHLALFWGIIIFCSSLVALWPHDPRKPVSQKCTLLLFLKNLFLMCEFFDCLHNFHHSTFLCSFLITFTRLTYYLGFLASMPMLYMICSINS